VIPEREDAYQNQRQLLEAAHETFTELGARASSREVARQAHVGIATLYRHFPNRTALVHPLILGDMHWLLRRGEAALVCAMPVDEMLDEWLTRFARVCMRYFGLPGMILGALHDDRSTLAPTVAAIRSLAERLLVRAQEAKVVRPDVSAEEILGLALGAAWAAERTVAGARSTVVLMAVVCRGLRPEHDRTRW
jgi:AcrR family transcriptional regulator